MKTKSRIISIAVALLMIALTTFSGITIFAEEKTAEVVLTDVTSQDSTTLKGEAKIKVSVRGIGGDVSIAQTALTFTGNLKYKSIEFLKGENNPDRGNAYVSPNAALANSNKKLDTSIICAKTPMNFKNSLTDLFILTFTGEAGDSVTVNLDGDSTYYTVDGKDLLPKTSSVEISANASSKANSGKKAKVTLKMDKVTDFAAGSGSEYESSDVELKITSESKTGYTIYTVLNNTLVSKGGHRENTTIPTFTVENTVVSGEKYTVEISGIGYVPYRKSGVTFNEDIVLTNDNFIPGDINSDEKVDSEDKTLCEEIIANRGYSQAADFNRDGVVNRYDLRVFDAVASGDNGNQQKPDDSVNKDDETEKDETEDKKLPAKLSGVTAEGKSRKVTVKWTKPTDSSVTGYVVNYGTDKNSLTKSENVVSNASSQVTIDDLNDNITYYFKVAAVNANGTGEFSDVVSAKTSKADEGSSGGGGGGGAAAGGSANAGTTAPTVPNQSEKTSIGGFYDIGEFGWAQSAIISLKNKGIISGVSNTEFAPRNNIKRGDFILILTRMLKLENEADGNFSDVPEGSYYYDAIGRAKAAGIASGDGISFNPENSITRQDLIVLSYRAFNKLGYIEETEDLSSLDEFIDKDDVADYARSAMASMVKFGIIKGSDSLVNPKGNATRAEVAVMCERLLGLIK